MRSETPVYDLPLTTGTSSSSTWEEFSYVLPEDAIFDGMDLVVNCQSGDALNVLWICIDRPLILPETTPLYETSFSNNLAGTLWEVSRSPDPVVVAWDKRFTIDWTIASGDVVADEGNPRINFGTISQLQVTPSGDDTQKVAFIQRPDVPYLLDGACLKLKLWNTLGTNGRILVYETTPFIESDVTWSHQPLFGNLVANVTVTPGENVIQLDSTAYAFALVALEATEDWGEGASFFSKESGTFGPQFAWEVANLWQGDGALYMQAEEVATYTLQSPVLAPEQLTSDDWVYVRFADNTSSEVSLSLLYSGLVQAEFIIAPLGEVLEKLHWRRFMIPSGLSVDQVQVTASLGTGEFVFIDELSLERPQVYNFIQANAGGSYNETVPLNDLDCHSPLAAFAADGWVLDNAVVPTFTQQLYLTESDVVDSMTPTETQDWLRRYFIASWHDYPQPYYFCERRTYFEIPQTPISFIDPDTSLFVYFSYGGAGTIEEVYDHFTLNVAPALGSFEEEQLCWNNQPGFDSTGIVWQLSASEIATTFVDDGFVPITGVTPGETYCMFVETPVSSESLKVQGYGDEGLYGDPQPYVTYTWDKVTSVNGSLVLQTDRTEVITVSRLTDIILPAGGQARAQLHGSLSNGASVKFYFEGGETLVWDPSAYLKTYPVECTFALPSGCHIIGVEVSGDLAADGQLFLDYLVIEEGVSTQSLEEVEWGGYRDVLYVPTYGSTSYSFGSAKTNDYMEFWLGGHGNCTIKLGDSFTPLNGVTFGLTNDRWWFVDGTEIRYTDHLHVDSWEHVRVAWNCDPSGPDTYSLTFENDTLAAVTGCLITGSPSIEALDHIQFAAGSGEGLRIDALSCSWQDICGPVIPVEGELPKPYTIGSNFGENILKNASGQLTFLALGHWREYYFRASESWFPYAGTQTCFVKATNVYSHECVGKFDFSVLVPNFYSSSFVVDSDRHLTSRELDAVFKYDFTLSNLGNAPQTYTVVTASLEPHAIPSFTFEGGLIDGVPEFSVTLGAGEGISIVLTLISPEPTTRCDFTVVATSMTSVWQEVYYASYFINDLPVVITPDDITYEQGTTGHALTWAISDASPVPYIQNWYGIYTNATSSGVGGFWGTYTFDAPVYDHFPPGWLADSPDVLMGAGTLGVPSSFGDDTYTNAWVTTGDQLAGTVEWNMNSEYGVVEAGLFRDGIPVATVIGGDGYGASVPSSFNGISMGQYFNYFSLTFDAAQGICHMHARSTWGSQPSWDSVDIPFSSSLVPNEFRVRVMGHWVSPWTGGWYGASASIDSLGFSWDSAYHVGDNRRIRLVETGTFDSAGDVLVYTVDGLLPDPTLGLCDYKYIFAASDGWVATGEDIRTVRVLTPNPVILQVSGDISYEYGTTGHSLAWQVLDVEAPSPSYEVWKAGAEMPGQYRGTETFQDVPAGDIPMGWIRDSPTKVGVVDEWAGHTSCLHLLSDDQTTHTTAFSFPAQGSGTVEWYMYWNLAGSLDMNFGDDQGFLSSITADSWNGDLEIHPPGAGSYWYPMPTFGGTWHRFAFNFNAFTGAFSFTVYSYGCEGWTYWNHQPYGVAASHTWTGTFGRQSSGISYLQLVSTPSIYGQTADWFIDSIGFSWDPLYDVGDLVNLEREKIQVKSGSWTSGDIIYTSVDGIEVGTHDYTFVARDGNGYASSVKSTVTVYNVAPVLTNEPSDLIFLAGSLAPSVEWTPSDASTSGATYHIVREGFGEEASGSWVSGVPITWNPSDLPVGKHHILLELDDGLGGTLIDEVIVKSNDQITFLGTPIDFSYHIGEPTFNIEWIVSDLLSLNPTYCVFMRGFEGETGLGDPYITNGIWASGTSSVITVNLGGMPVGLYLASMVVSDGLGAQAADQVVFCVTPEGMNPLDWLEAVLVEAGSGVTCGTSSGDVIVDVTFDTAEDTQMAIGIWDTPPQPEGPDFATEGIYFTVDAEREAAVTFPIYVTVTLPGGFPIGMTESDVAAWLRFLYFDELSQTWVDSHFPIVDIDMVAGTATFEVWHLSTFALGFANGLPPKIDGSGFLTYEFGTTDPQLVTWRIADLTLGFEPAYAIYRDGFLLSKCVWSFGTEAVIDVAGLPIGVYDFEIIAVDGLGGSSANHVSVEVYNVAPVVSTPSDITYEAGSTGNTVVWIPMDISIQATSYFVAVDGTQIFTGPWVSGSEILVEIDHLMPGTHCVDLTLNDGCGGSNTDQVLVVVTNKEPVISAPAPITYEDGDPRPVAQWVIEDSSVLSGTYDLLLDGAVVSSGTWSSGVPVVVNVGGLLPATHTYRFVARDGYGAVNEAIATVFVLPDDDTEVTIANLNATATHFNVSVTFQDIDPSSIASVDWIRVNGTAIANYTVGVSGTQWVVTFDLAFPRDGMYLVEVQVSDADVDRPSDAASQIFSTGVNVTGCDPIKSLMEGVLAKIDLLQLDIDAVDCWVWQKLLAFFAGRAENRMIKALDLYLAGNKPAATIRVWVAQCAMHVGDILVQVGEMIGAIDPDLAVELEAHVTSIRTDLSVILLLLGGNA